MKFRPLLFLMLITFSSNSFAQPQSGVGEWGDAAAAEQYVIWVRQAIDEGRMREALTVLERAADFANVSSDISFLLALARSREGRNRGSIIEALDKAVEVNRWGFYNENQALLLKAEQLIAMRMFTSALAVLDRAGASTDFVSANAQAEAAILRILALKGMAAGNGTGGAGLEPAQALVRFRSEVFTAMSRFPRDPRPLRIFFEYARNTRPEPSDLPSGDLNLLDLAMRRLPFLLGADPELAWMAAPLMRDTEAARRIMAAYRAGGLPPVYIHVRDFMPSPPSISAALNLGLIDDITAAEELFSGNRGINYPLPPGFVANGDPVIEKNIIEEVYALLRSEQGRNFFSGKLLSFSGIITSDDDNDGYINSRAHYRLGVIREYAFDLNQDNIFDIRILFGADGVPVSAEYPITGQLAPALTPALAPALTPPALVSWERYPSVGQVTLAGESFLFRPADFHFAPIELVTLGGSRNLAGLVYPVLLHQNMELTRRALVSFCTSIRRPSIEFDGATEEIFLERGVPLRAVETLNGKQVSITEFEGGLPVIQYLDLDLDDRMETVRRFHRPPVHSWDEDTFNYRSLIISSESDWTGEGRYKTGEVYLQDGSVVYSLDMSGSGVMTYSETETGKEQ